MPDVMDERVVSMSFDNKKFEKNVKSSIKTIDDLKESLDFKDSTESLDELNKKFKELGKTDIFDEFTDSADGFKSSMTGFGDATKKSSGLLNAFSKAFKITALFKAAKNALDSLERSIKQFSIAPISEGFEKYNTKIASIKTIANATGMAADAVNSSLERLNWFTDETSASFGNMVNNIGKFTAVGKGLDESITAMEGIATWGYHSGAGVNEINRAMYNLSQALGTGSVKLIDWKSIENAGMATKGFKEQAIAAAEAAGTLKRKGDKLFTTGKGKSEEVSVSTFNSTLAKGWFSSDVLMSVLKEYGGFADKVKKYQEAHPEFDLAADAMQAMDEERLTKAAKSFSKFAEMTSEEVNESLSEIMNDPELTDKERLSKLQDFVDKVNDDVLKKFAKNSKKTEKEIKSDLDKILNIKNAKEREKAIKKLSSSIGVDSKEITKYLNAYSESMESLGEKAFKSSQQAKSFSEALEATKDAVSTGWMNTFQHIFGGLDKSVELWTDVTNILWDLFAAGASFRNNAFLHWAEEFGGREDLWGEDGVLHNIMDTIIELKELLGTTFKNVFFPSLENAMGLHTDDVVNLQNGLYTVGQIMERKEGSFFGKQLKNITNGIKEFTAKIRAFFTASENVKKIENIFRGIAQVIKFAWHLVSSLFKAIGTLIKKSGVLEDILGLLSFVGTLLSNVFKGLEDSGIFSKVLENIANSIAWLYNLIKSIVMGIIGFFEDLGIGKAISDFFDLILGLFTGGNNKVDKKGAETESAFYGAFSWLESVKEWIEKIDVRAGLHEFVGWLESSGVLPKIREWWANISAFFVKMYNDVVVWLENSGILPKIRSIWAGITTFFSNIETVWGTFTNALNGGTLNKKQAKVDGLSSTLISVLEVVQTVGAKIRQVFDTVVGWLENTGILPTIRSVWDGITTFFSNLGTVWSVFTNAINGGKFNKKQAKIDGLSARLISILEVVQKIGGKLKKAFAKVKEWFNIAIAWIVDKWQLFVDWLESSGILPKIRSIWKSITDFFGNIGTIWDIFVNKKGKYDPDKFTEDQLGTIQKVEKFVQAAGEKIEEIKMALSNLGQSIVDWLENSGVLPTLRSWWDAIVTWFEGVKKDIEENGVFKTVGDFFTDLWEKITGLFGSSGQGEQEAAINLPAINMPEIIPNAEGGEQGGGFFQTILDAFKDENGNFNLFAGIANGIRNLFNAIGSADWAGMSSSVFEPIVDILNGADDAFGRLHIDNIIAVVEKVCGAISGVLISKAIVDLTSTIKSFVKSHSKAKSGSEKFQEIMQALGDALLKLGITVAIIAASIWLVSLIKPEDLKRVLPIFEFIAWFFIGLIAATIIFAKNDEKLTSALNAMATIFLNIGIAVALIVGSIIVLSFLLSNKTFSEHLAGSLAIVAGILVAMIGVIWAISALTKGKTVRIAAGIAVFAGMAILIATITVCLLLLSLIEWGRAFADLLLLGMALAGIIVAMKVLDKVRINKNTIKTLIILTVVIALLTASFLLLQGVDLVHMGVSTLALVGVMLAMAKAIKMMDKVKIQPKTVVALGIMALSIAIIAGALYLLKDVDPIHTLANAVALGGVLMALGASLKMMDKVKITGKIIAAIAVMAVAVAIIGVVLYILKDVDPVHTLANAVALGGVLIALGTSLKIMDKVKITGKIIAAIAVMAVAVAIIGFVLFILDDTDPVHTLASAVAISAVLIALGTAMRIMNNLKIKGTVIASMAVMAGVIAIIAGALYILKDSDPVHTLANAVALSSVLIAMGTAFKIMNNLKIKGTVIASIAVMAGVIAIIAGALYILKDADPVHSIVNAVALSGVLIALSAAMKIMNNLKIKGTVIASIAVMAGVIAILAGAFYVLKDVDPVTLGVAAVSISLVLIAMAGALLLVKDLGPSALKGAAIFAAAIVIIMAGLAAAGVIMSAAVKRMINDLVSIMSSLSAASISAKQVDKDAIIDAIGLLDDLVAAFAKVLTADTKNALTVANDTWTVLVRLANANQSAKQIDISKFEAIFGKGEDGGLFKTICDGLSGITETGQAALTLTKNLVEIGQNLQLFGESASKFVGNNSKYAGGIKNLIGKDGKGGLLASIKTSVEGVTDTGWNARMLLWNLTDIGNHIELLSGSGSKLGGDAETNIGNVKDRLQDLVEIVRLARELTVVGTDGVTTFDPTTIATGIANIGAALELYNKAIEVYKEEVGEQQGVDLDAGESVKPISTDNIKTALDMIVSALPNISPDDDKVEAIEKWAGMPTGENNQTLFALGLVNMANALTTFSESAQNYDSEKGQKAINALSMLAGIYTTTGMNDPGQYNQMIDGVSGWNSMGVGDNNAFSSAIIGMGNALSNFSTSAQNYDEVKGQQAIEALRMLGEIYNSTGMNNPSQYNNMIEGVQGWDLGEEGSKNSFVGAIVGMGNAMSSFGDSVRNIPSESVTNATTALDTLAKIYEKLSSNESMLEYFSDTEGSPLAALASRLGKKSVAEVFTDFGEGIGKIGSAMGSFAQAISAEENHYDPDKVSAATKIVQDLGELQIALRKSKLEQAWWKSDENLETLGHNLSGLGSRLTTFSNELKGTDGNGFDLDTTSAMWTNVKEVLTFLTGISTDLGEIEYETSTINVGSGASHYDRSASRTTILGYSISEMTQDLGTLSTKLNEFNGAMAGATWTSETWTNVHSVLTALKDITLEFKRNGLKENDFYDLDAFGFDIGEIFYELNNNGTGISDVAEFMKKIASTDSNIDVGSFVKFMDSVKILAEATTILHGQSVTQEDIQSLNTLISGIMGIDASGFSAKGFSFSGLSMAAEFISGFITRLKQVESVKGEATFSTAFDELIATIDSYASRFKESGKTAGQQYAAGFKEGMADVTSFLSPVVAMDNDGNTSGGGQTSLASILQSMNYATTADISSVITHLTTLNSKFDNPINVNDSHKDIVNSITATNTTLGFIKNDISQLERDVNNLKVYIDSNRLVGAIAGKIDRYLGTNVSP